VGPKITKSKSRDPDHAHLEVIHHPSDSTCRGLSNKEKTKCLASPVQKLRRGSQNLKSRSRDPDHAHLGVIHHTLDSTRCGLANKEKMKSLVSPVKKLRKGSRHLKSRSRDPGHAPFDPKMLFFVGLHLCITHTMLC